MTPVIDNIRKGAHRLPGLNVMKTSLKIEDSEHKGKQAKVVVIQFPGCEYSAKDQMRFVGRKVKFLKRKGSSSGPKELSIEFKGDKKCGYIIIVK